MLLDTLRQLDRLERDLFDSHGKIGGPVDIRREADRYVIDADLPGVDPESVDVTVEGESLTIRAERSDTRTTEDAQWVVHERGSSRFLRRFVLSDIDPDGIQADFHDGVLSVVVPIAPGSRRHRIPVGVGSSAEPQELTGSATPDPATTEDEGKADAAHSQAS